MTTDDDDDGPDATDVHVFDPANRPIPEIDCRLSDLAAIPPLLRQSADAIDRLNLRAARLAGDFADAMDKGAAWLDPYHKVWSIFRDDWGFPDFANLGPYLHHSGGVTYLPLRVRFEGELPDHSDPRGRILAAIGSDLHKVADLLVRCEHAFQRPGILPISDETLARMRGLAEEIDGELATLFAGPSADPLASYWAEIDAYELEMYRRHEDDPPDGPYWPWRLAADAEALKRIDARHGIAPGDPRVYSIRGYLADRARPRPVLPGQPSRLLSGDCCSARHFPRDYRHPVTLPEMWRLLESMTLRCEIMTAPGSGRQSRDFNVRKAMAEAFMALTGMNLVELVPDEPWLELSVPEWLSKLAKLRAKLEAMEQAAMGSPSLIQLAASTTPPQRQIGGPMAVQTAIGGAALPAKAGPQSRPAIEPPRDILTEFGPIQLDRDDRTAYLWGVPEWITKGQYDSLAALIDAMKAGRKGVQTGHLVSVWKAPASARNQLPALRKKSRRWATAIRAKPWSIPKVADDPG